MRRWGGRRGPDPAPARAERPVPHAAVDDQQRVQVTVDVEDLNERPVVERGGQVGQRNGRLDQPGAARAPGRAADLLLQDPLAAQQACGPALIRRYRRELGRDPAQLGERRGDLGGGRLGGRHPQGVGAGPLGPGQRLGRAAFLQRHA